MCQKPWMRIVTCKYHEEQASNLQRHRQSKCDQMNHLFHSTMRITRKQVSKVAYSSPTSSSPSRGRLPHSCNKQRHRYPLLSASYHLQTSLTFLSPVTKQYAHQEPTSVILPSNDYTNYFTRFLALSQSSMQPHTWNPCTPFLISPPYQSCTSVPLTHDIIPRPLFQLPPAHAPPHHHLCIPVPVTPCYQKYRYTRFRITVV